MKPDLTPEQQDGHRVATRGMNKAGLSRARQIASQRSFTYERQPVVCVRCLGPRDKHKHPVCGNCAGPEMA